MRTIKLCLAALAIMLTVSANAQSVIAGYNISKATTSNATPLNGFHVGLSKESAIEGPLSLQYALLYNFQTATDENSALGQTATATTNTHSLDLPIRVAYTMPLDSKLSVFGFAGPNLNYYLSNKTTLKTTGIIDTTTEGENIYTQENGDGKKYYSPFDIQLGIGAGVKYNNISIRVSYDWGMLDRDLLNDNTVWKNNDLKISLVYSL